MDAVALFKRSSQPSRPGGGVNGTPKTKPEPSGSSAAAPTEAEVIAGFWNWWTAEGADAVAAAITADQETVMVELLDEHLGPVAPGLAWELSEGATSRYRLVVGADGDPDLRAVARRWLRAAPESSTSWEYTDVRPPAADLTDVVLSLEDRPTITLDEVVVAIERRGHLLDVLVHHPAFPELSDEETTEATLAAVDAALGETDVQTWIGRLEATTQTPAGAVGLRDLAGAVADLRADSVYEDGTPTWVLLRGSGPRGQLVAAAQVPLASASAPHLDQHVMVRLGFGDRAEDGLPDPEALEALRDLEDHLVEQLAGELGDSAHLLAQETTDGVRTLHFYVESTAAIPERVAALVVEAWPEGSVEVGHEMDPDWSAVRHLRT